MFLFQLFFFVLRLSICKFFKWDLENIYIHACILIMYCGRNRKRHHCNYARIKTFKGVCAYERHVLISIHRYGINIFRQNMIRYIQLKQGSLWFRAILSIYISIQGFRSTLLNTWIKRVDQYLHGADRAIKRIEPHTGALIWSTFLLQKYTILIFMTINKKISILVFQYVSTYCTIIMI